MKKILFIVFGIATIFSSCDVLEGPFDEQVAIDTTSGPKRKILLEDFTGHTCGNCPCAGKEAARLDSIYHGRVIVVAEHVGFFADPYGSGTKFRSDFKTQAGEEVSTSFDIGCNSCGIGLPAGMVNRTKYNNDRVLSSTAWSSAIGTLLADTSKPTADITIAATYNSANRTASVEVNSKYLKAGNSNHQLVVYVVEDSVINWQKFYASCSPTGADIDVPNFVHRHMLRGSINSTWGEVLYSSGSTIPVGTSVNKAYTKILDNSWDEKHIYFVAFIQDNVTKEVVQVEEVKLIE